MPDLLTARQVCDELGLSGTTLDRWIAAGDIVVHRKLPGIRGPRLFTADHIKRVGQRRLADRAGFTVARDDDAGLAVEAFDGGPA